MARILFLPGQPDRPSYPSTQTSQATSSQGSSTAMQSSVRPRVLDSDDDDDDDDESIVVRPASTKQKRQLINKTATTPPDDESTAAKPTRRKRMLLEVDAGNILTPESVDDDSDDQDFTPELRISGLRAPTFDQGATRRSSRHEAKKPRVYNTKIHPQDYALGYRGTTIVGSMTDGEDTPPGSPYRPDKNDDQQDIVRAPHDSDIEVIEDSSAPGFPTPDPRATRRSRRSEAHKKVSYNMRVHPNDRDLGIYTGRARKQPQQGQGSLKSRTSNTGARIKRQSTSHKWKSMVVISDDAEHSDEDDTNTHLASPQHHERYANQEDVADYDPDEIFSELNDSRPIRHRSDESDTIVVRPALQAVVNAHFTNLVVDDELDYELLDGFNNSVDTKMIDEPDDTISRRTSSNTASVQLPPHKALLLQGERPQTSSMLVEASQHSRLKTPNIDDFHTMLTRNQANLPPGRDAVEQQRKRTSNESATLSHGSEKRVSNGSTTLSDNDTARSLAASSTLFRAVDSANDENRRPSAGRIRVVR